MEMHGATNEPLLPPTPRAGGSRWSQPLLTCGTEDDSCGYAAGDGILTSEKAKVRAMCCPLPRSPPSHSPARRLRAGWSGQ